MGEAATIPIAPEEARVINWRSEWLRAAGYSKRNVELLATSKVDLWFACDALTHALARGYDEDYVINLLL
jgi:hypothetical protein